MNVNKLLTLVVLIPFLCFSQKGKNEDVYFIINKNHEKYIVSKYINNPNFNPLKLYSSIGLYDRTEYNKRQKRINKEKREGRYFGAWGEGSRIPKTLTFRLKKNKKQTISHCDIHKENLKIIDYKWLINNSWTENNPNILFKDLYFLFKVEKDKYIKYKVERTVIAY